MKFIIPVEVGEAISVLEKNGFEAYMVGGCVRDNILGLTPADYDICTDATPAETIECFHGRHIAETGVKYGAVTITVGEMPIEITTYRVDGKYSDNRRPDNVIFVKDLKRDLTRRDFTINAMAYHPIKGLTDLFGGINDLNAGLIRTVGDPTTRFSEDALRIMRALRFAAVLGFDIETETADAMENCRSLLNNIAPERISSELNKLILGQNLTKLLTRHLTILGEFLPEIMPASGFRQNNPYHCFDVLTHTLTAVDNAPKDVIVRLAMLFHDIAKPHCYTEKDGVGHFYGHPQKSADMAEVILRRLHYGNKVIRSVIKLIQYHDTEIKAECKHVKHMISKIGEVGFNRLIEVKRADTKAKANWCQAEKLEQIEKLASV